MIRCMLVVKTCSTGDGKQESQETITNNQTPARANKTKKKYHRFLHRGKPVPNYPISNFGYLYIF